VKRVNSHPRLRTRPFDFAWPLFVGSLLLSVTIGGVVALFEGISYIVAPGVLLIIVTGLIALRYERLPLYLLVATLPLVYILNSDTIPTSFLIVPGALAILSWLQHAGSRTSIIVVDRRAISLAILLGVIATISSVRAGTADALAGARSYWLVIVLFFLMQNMLLEERQIVMLAWVMAISLGLLGAYVVFAQLQMYVSGGSPSASALHDNRLDVGNINGTAMWLTAGLPFAMQLGLTHAEPSRTRRFILACCAVLMILGIVSTLSISANVGLVVVLGLAVLWSKRRAQRCVLALFCLMVIALALVSPLAERLEHQLWLLEEKDPIYWGTYRGLAWYSGIQAMRQEPWLGNGPSMDTVTAAALPYLPLDFLRWMTSRGATVFIPHNMFLSVGAELGIPGLLAFVALLATVMLPLWRATRNARAGSDSTRIFYLGQAVLIGLVALLVQGLGLSSHLNKYLWLLLGVGVAITRLSVQSESREPEHAHTKKGTSSDAT
jgi:O-antigen ligase